jgi:hypothetical protein
MCRAADLLGEGYVDVAALELIDVRTPQVGRVQFRAIKVEGGSGIIFGVGRDVDIEEPPRRTIASSRFAQRRIGVKTRNRKENETIFSCRTQEFK